MCDIAGLGRINCHRCESSLSCCKLIDHGFYLKISKCFFGGNQVAYLGHIVSNIGVSTDVGKIEVVVNSQKKN